MNPNGKSDQRQIREAIEKLRETAEDNAASIPELHEETGLSEDYGDIQYLGNTDAVVLAEGPGLGPAVGIAERAANEGKNARIIHTETSPPHADRLNAIKNDHVSVTSASTTEELLNGLADVSNEQIYVFGFAEFVQKAKEALGEADIDPGSAEIESFGPK